MDKLDKNLLISLAIDLDMSDLLALCQTSKRMNALLCANDNFWMQKLYKDYPETIGKFQNVENRKNYFRNIYRKTKNAIISEKDLDEINIEVNKTINRKDLHTDWRKAKFLAIDISYLYEIRALSVSLSLVFYDADGEEDIDLSDIYWDFLGGLVPIISEKLWEEFKIEKSPGEKKINFPEEIPGAAILDIFAPSIFKQVKLVYRTVVNYRRTLLGAPEPDIFIYTEIDDNTLVPVERSPDT